MILDFLYKENNLLALFYILIGLLIGLVLMAIFYPKKGKKDSLLEKYFAENELFLRISKDFHEKIKSIIESEIKANLSNFKNEIEKLSKEIIQNYKSYFEKESEFIKTVSSEITQKLSQEEEEAKKQIINIQQKASEVLINEAEKSSVTFLNNISNEFKKVRNIIHETLTNELQKTKLEIESYKTEKLQEIDEKIYNLVAEVAKKTIGKAIDLSEHEKLVIEALEKAKKEIF